MFTLYPPLFDFSCVTKCMGRRNLVGRCAWAELEWCNYSRTLPILPSFPYLRALPYPFHFPNADKLKTSDVLGPAASDAVCIGRRDLSSCSSTVMWKHSCFEATLIMRVFTFLCGWRMFLSFLHGSGTWQLSCPWFPCVKQGILINCCMVPKCIFPRAG